MKKLTKLLTLGVLLFSISAYSQDESSDLDQFVNDMLFLADGFASPASESAAYQGTAGWFTSARALDEWKVDISLHANAIFVPTSKKEFTVNNNDFSFLEITGDDRGILPTAFGGQSDISFKGRRSLEYGGQTYTVEPFDAIDGIDKGALMYPFVQVSVGLPYGTEIGVRALPSMEIDGSEFSTYGIGLKHNISQYFRFNEEEDLQVAGILSYNIFDVSYEFEPIDIPSVLQLNLIDVNANVWMAEVMASKKYENFEIFGALGVAQSDFEYEFGGSGPALPLINTSLMRLQDKEAQFKGDVGFNLYFNRFKISTMATAGKFVNLNMGLHFIL